MAALPLTLALALTLALTLSLNQGFVGSPIEWRPKDGDPWQTSHPEGDTTAVMAKELRERMEACPGGGSRFGALSIVLGDMGFTWQMYTPPYIILLIRTFLTLEGIAGQVDPLGDPRLGPWYSIIRPPAKAISVTPLWWFCLG